MTLNYQLTFEDFREAHLGVRPEKKSRWRVGATVIGWVLLLGIIIAPLVLLKASTKRNGYPELPPEPAPSPMARLLAGLAPSIACMCLFGFLIYRQSVRPLPEPWNAPATLGKKRPTSGRGLIGWIVFIVLAMALFTIMNSRRVSVPPPGPPPRGAPTPAPAIQAPPSLTTFDFLPGIIPWVTMFIMLVIVARLGGDRTLRRTWDAQPFLHRPESIDVDASRVTFSGSLSRKEYAWSYFPGFRETPNLFLLYVSPMGFHIIPKRAFANPADLNIFRGYLLNEVKTGQFLEQPSAFPVVPMAQVSSAAPPPLPPVR